MARPESIPTSVRWGQIYCIQATWNEFPIGKGMLLSDEKRIDIELAKMTDVLYKRLYQIVYNPHTLSHVFSTISFPFSIMPSSQSHASVQEEV